MKAARIALLSGILLFSGGCFLGKKPRVQIPVAVPPPPVASTPAPEPAPPEQLPAVSTVPPQTQPAPSQPTPTTPPVESGKPSPFPPVARPTPPKPATVTPPPVTVTPTPAPALGAMLTPELRKQLDATYVSDLNQANQILGRLSGKTLTTEQKDSVNRAQAWIRQAGEYHNKDLATAAELARRARLLTQDLASALK